MNLFRLKKLFKLLTKNITFSKVLHFNPILLASLIFQDFLPGDRAIRLVIS